MAAGVGLAATVLLLVRVLAPGGAPPEGPPPGPGPGPADGRPSYLVRGGDGATRLFEGEALAALEPRAIEVWDLGEVRVEPGAKVRAERIAEDEHRLFLEAGRLEAEITAAPRVFQVGTPAGLAVDLGCAYLLSVDEATGATALEVTGGLVAIEAAGAEVTVPAGARCAVRPDERPDVPLWSNAPASVADLAGRLMGGGPPLETDLAWLEEVDDTLLLYHLLDAPDEAAAETAWWRLQELVPLGKTVKGPLDLGDEDLREEVRGRLLPDWLRGSPWPD